MTGEISLRGRVLRVGGVKEKILAAVRFGVKHIILPEQNKSDWLEVPTEARNKVKAHFVNHISQVVRIALELK
jgi:ATP-dependent Lon protease